MMACGHRANSLGREAGATVLGPACVICGCFQVTALAPDLSERRARCHYYGKSVRKSECNYNGDRDGVCYCEQPSDAPLPFFEYLGPGSLDSVARCTCGLYERPHRQPWEAVVMVDRNWFKRGRIEMRIATTLYARTLEEAQAEAERERVRRVGWDGPGGGKEETHIFGARVAALEKKLRTVKCSTFRPRGPQDYDSFYCGCHSWD